MYPWLTDCFNQLHGRLMANKLHHGLLLQGPQGLGKTAFAEQLAQLILCSHVTHLGKCGQCQSCLLLASGTHPDFHQVLSDKQIGVDAIRDAIKKLTGSAQLSGAKVLLIHQADSMTESSANALLKTLEEPTPNTYLLLTTSRPERLLPTIHSRCEKLSLPLPSFEITLNWVSSQYPEPIDQDFAKLFATRPLALLAELNQQQDDSLTFSDFKHDLEQAITGHKSLSVVANAWQAHTDKVLVWLQFWVKEQALGAIEHRAIDSWLTLSQQLILATQKAQNPGLNKVLLLSQILTFAAQASHSK